jgi:hypothetical protein
VIAILMSAALCVAQTDVCAPERSTITGTVGPTGGRVTITPAAVMTALGAQFSAGVALVVDVQPWSSSDGARRLHLAAGAVSTTVNDDVRTVSGTLARSETIAGQQVQRGPVSASSRQGGAPTLANAALASSTVFEQWQLPAGTAVQRWPGGWSFKAPHGQHARAIADHLGERIDEVIEARFDANQTTFTLSSPHALRGTTLSVDSLAIEHATHCVDGYITTPQRSGIFTLPDGGSVRVCGTTIVLATGPYGGPTLQVGRWFATEARAGAKDARPPSPDDPTRSTLLITPLPPAPSAVTGYWIQINSLCQGASGIPQPPPPRQWIWVDLHGEAARSADRTTLASFASKRGTGCPVTPCCVP